MARTSSRVSPGYGVPGQRWLGPARLAAALLLLGLTLFAGEGYRWPGLVYLAAGMAGVTALLGGWVRRSRNVISLLFLADLGWIGLAVVASGSSEVGFTLLFPLVAFGAGLTVGGKRALGLSLLAGGRPGGPGHPALRAPRPIRPGWRCRGSWSWCWGW